MLRKNKRTINGTISLGTLVKVFVKHGIRVNAEIKSYLVDNFVVTGAVAEKLRKVKHTQYIELKIFN